MPDIGLLPAIANYFDVTIDQLFGYNGDHERKIDAILKEEEELAQADKRAQDCNLDQRIALLRAALEEFTENERLMQRLAETLHQAGYTKRGEGHDLHDGYYVMNTVYNKTNPYWQEAISLYEHIKKKTADPGMADNANRALIYLYGTVGECEKAKKCAADLPDVHNAREIIITRAVEGKEREIALGNAVLVLLHEGTELMMQNLVYHDAHFADPMLPLTTVKNVIALYDLIFTDQNYGVYHAELALLYLYLSEWYWRCGMRDETFAALDIALVHARKFDSLWKRAHSTQNGEEGELLFYTAPLLDTVPMDFSGYTAWDGNMASTLPETWPFWCFPNYRPVLDEMVKDSRWALWVQKTQEEV